ncbi:hypothetical protein [Microbacterium aoyamense]|nr:hypothetical protein [Microbacterium aoyamense]
MALVTRGGGRIRLNEALVRENAPFIDSRTLVVAVGSNASPQVIERKYARADHVLSHATPFMTCSIEGIGIGHSAHVSKGGYIAATPFARVHHRQQFVASWFDDDQLALVDSTEPNYERVLVSGREYPLTLESGERPEHYYLYVSTHGLIRDHVTDSPLPFRSQGELFEWLRAATGDDTFAGPAAEVCLRLIEPGIQQSTTELLHRSTPAIHGLRVVDRAAVVHYGATRDLARRGDGLLAVLPTADRVARKGENVISVGATTKERLGLSSHALVSAEPWRGASRPGVVAAVVEDASLPDGVVGADQVVRNALGVERQEHVSLRPVSAKRSRLGTFLIGRSIVLFCRVEAADLANVEQDVVLCDPLVLHLLGIQDASRIIIEGAPAAGRDDAPTLRIRAVTITDELSARRRELSGGSLTARYPSSSDALGVFPDLPRLYLDARYRQFLGLGTHKLAAVRVRASRGDQTVRELRELVLIFALAIIGIATSLTNPVVVGVFFAVLIAALIVVRERLRGQLGVRKTKYRR